MPATRTWSMSRVLVLVVSILSAVALILMIIAGALVLHTRTFLAESEVATGTVVELVARQSCSRDDDDRVTTCSWVYAPRVRFTTGDGREIEFVSSTASSPPSYAEGDAVQVLYRPDRPADARIDSYADLWLAPTIVGGIGVFFAAFAIGWAVLARRVRAQEGRELAEPEGSEPGVPASDEPEEPEPNTWQDPGTLR
jgi:hypothetical protein